MHLHDLQAFLSELSENNHRAWMAMNKPRYDILRNEFLELTAALINNLKRTDPAIANTNPAKALFRINRDVRFSKDKSPYKTIFSASIVPDGRKKPSEGGGPAYYFQFDAQGVLLFAVGEYLPPPHRLRQIRDQLISDGNGFLDAIHQNPFRSNFPAIRPEGRLVKVPRAYPAEHPMREWLKYKSFIAVNEISYLGMSAAEVKKQLLTAFESAKPLIYWLRTPHHVAINAHPEL
ncbi:DUF2461 domain-containing protein [Undibacterium squillarum]|uniref:DUF2461 domain-containing protein n=1 Tax=Undibacterium squillarum TaxID=1131567 RepID=UPI0035B369EE